MGSEKNQHFVPKVHLRPFSPDARRRSIHLFNIKNCLAIPNASIKHQCSSDYFYGEDKQLERHLSKLEGEYAEVVRQVQADTFNKKDEPWARTFMVVQSCRTEMAMEHAREFHRKLAAVRLRNKSIGEQEKPDLSDQPMLIFSMRRMRVLMGYTMDLCMVVVRNLTSVPFITSDNPLVHTNRFHIQKLNKAVFGLGSSGAMIFLPVSPRYALALFDKDIYAVDAVGGYLDIKKTKDAISMNDFQILNADENLYFSAISEAALLKQRSAELTSRRLTERVNIHELVEVPGQEGFQTFKKVETKEEDENAAGKLIMSQSVMFKPENWPSVFPFRFKPKYFYNGSAYGHVRQEEWLHGIIPEG